jgi:hypothetical protein
MADLSNCIFTYYQKERKNISYITKEFDLHSRSKGYRFGQNNSIPQDSNYALAPS